MKYFITEAERKQTKSTCFIEFQHGRYEGEIWHIDSICMDEEIFYDLKLKRLFSSLLEQFDYFGITQVTEEQFVKIKAAASNYLPETSEAIEELNEWLGKNEPGSVLFTIIGM